MLNALRTGLDKIDYKALAPPGSLGMVVTFADRAQIRVPMGPLDTLRGPALGTQKDYADTRGVELVKGIELALAELREVKNPVEALIILTDGNDTNPDEAKRQLLLLKKRAATDRVQTFAIVYKAADSAPMDLVSPVFPRSTVTKAEDIAPSILKSLQGIGNRQYVTFPGYHKDTKSGLAWDGKAHELVLEIDGQPTEPQSLVLTPKWTPTTGAGAAPPAKR